MTIEEEKLDYLTVIKRSGKKVEWNGTKIAIAIKKAFDSLEKDEEKHYSEKDVNKVYNAVIKRIEKEYKNEDKIKIEAIQDLIEAELQKQGYPDVYKEFSDYRERRNVSRQIFFGEKKQHKFLKALESLGLKSSYEENAKRENANVDGDTAMGTMLQYGSTVSKEFAKAYLMKPKFAEAHDGGDIHIHDMDFLPMGTTTCCQIDIKKLFKNGFSTGHGFLREPKDIMSYTALAAIAIQANQNDQHGGQAIPAFDYYMAPGVLATFKKQLKQSIYDYLDLTDFEYYINMDKIAKEIDKLNSGEYYPISPSFLLTIHKSQGRSIDNIIVCIDDLFDVSMMYTAITRAKNNLLFYSKETDDNKRITTLIKNAYINDFKQLNILCDYLSHKK